MADLTFPILSCYGLSLVPKKRYSYARVELSSAICSGDPEINYEGLMVIILEFLKSRHSS